MEKQSLIRRTLSSPAGFARLAGILEGEEFECRSAAGRRVCEAFGFFDARRRPQLTGCLSALSAMERGRRGPENLGAAMGLVAAMGGHLHRKHDRPPGHQVVWFGYAALAGGSLAAERARRLGPESAMYKLLRPN